VKTVTFKDKNQTFEFTAKEEFLNICPNPSEHNVTSLMKDNLYKYLHNEKGPAIRCLLVGKEKSKIYIVNDRLVPPNTDLGKRTIQQIESGTFDLEQYEREKNETK
jgi:hypothetical protein